MMIAQFRVFLATICGSKKRLWIFSLRFESSENWNQHKRQIVVTLKFECKMRHFCNFSLAFFRVSLWTRNKCIIHKIIQIDGATVEIGKGLCASSFTEKKRKFSTSNSQWFMAKHAHTCRRACACIGPKKQLSSTSLNVSYRRQRNEFLFSFFDKARNLGFWVNNLSFRLRIMFLRNFLCFPSFLFFVSDATLTKTMTTSSFACDVNFSCIAFLFSAIKTHIFLSFLVCSEERERVVDTDDEDKQAYDFLSCD